MEKEVFLSAFKDKSIISQFFLQSINHKTYLDIIKNKDKYKNVLLVFTKMSQIEEHHLQEVFRQSAYNGRWHVEGDPTNVTNVEGQKMVQTWFANKELLSFFQAKIEPQFAYIIKTRIKNA